MMRAAYIREYGNEEKLIVGDVPAPSVGDNQVLIKVKGAGINPIDWLVRDGFLAEQNVHTLPIILGWDAAGKVLQRGRNVTHLDIGQDVYVYAPIHEQGTYSEYISVDSQYVTAIPQSLDLLTAAAVPLAASTAWQALTQGCQLESGDKVLIHNASGGVGSFAVQIAKALGAYVIATASAKNRDFVIGLGADEFIDYRTQNFEQLTQNLDAVLVAVGGDDLVSRSLSVIKAGGYLVSLLDEIDEQLAKVKNIHYQRWMVMPSADDLKDIGALIDAGQIKVHIDSVFKLDQIKEAHILSQSKRARGKIIIDMST